MSFDINEAVFDSEGTYLEEKAVRYEEALMEQFATSRSVTSVYGGGKSSCGANGARWRFRVSGVK